MWGFKIGEYHWGLSTNIPQFNHVMRLCQSHAHKNIWSIISVDIIITSPYLQSCPFHGFTGVVEEAWKNVKDSVLWQNQFLWQKHILNIYSSFPIKIQLLSCLRSSFSFTMHRPRGVWQDAVSNRRVRVTEGEFCWYWDECCSFRGPLYGGGGGEGDKTTLIGSAVASYQQLGEWKVIQIS